MNPAVDIVIPLSAESVFGDFELRMALRSIDLYGRNVGRIHLVCETRPEWCRNICHLLHGDPHRCNKDANLFAKLLFACRSPEVSERFLFWSDDQLALRAFDAARLPPVANNRAARHFSDRNRWQRRMLHTFAYLRGRGLTPDWNWDSHVPQPIDKQRFLRLIAPVDYAALPGFCINTLYFGLAGVKPLVMQSQVKLTCENDCAVAGLPADKLYLGYNDRALRNGLKPLLEERFPLPSRYERS